MASICRRISPLAVAVFLGIVLPVTGAHAEVKIGLILSLTGPAASIGIPYENGVAVAIERIPEIAGEKLKLITLDDASDPSTAARDARKLIEQDNVDIILGSAGAPASLAAANVAYESKVPMIILAPAVMKPNQQDWEVTVVQPMSMMIAGVVNHMKEHSITTVAFIGFNDAAGDVVYDALTRSAAPAGIKVVTDQRYGRTDTSVMAQVLKIIASQPQAVLTGGSGTPGALSHLTLAERGYSGATYSSPASTNKDFLRLAGAAVNGMIIPAGPFVVFEQLPDNNPIKQAAAAFKSAWLKVNGEWTNDAFAAYGYDGWLIMSDAVKRAAGKGRPGTPEYRQALRDALYQTTELAGAQAIYNFRPGSPYGADERSRVIVQWQTDRFKLVQ
jgi:branched-chain amino acid transport system substrate-binding protein